MRKAIRYFLSGLSLVWVLTIAACGPALMSPRQGIGHMADEPFLDQLKPYLAEGEGVEELERVAPEPGYLSEVEVLKQAADYFISNGMLDLQMPINRNGVDMILDQSWLLQTKVHRPILVHNFNPLTTADRPNGYDYFYILHASHPVMGSVYNGVYVYNENSGNQIGLATAMGPAVSYRAHEFQYTWEQTQQATLHRITQREARQFFEQMVGEDLRGDPVAIFYPYKGPMDRQNFHWYFETTGSRSAAAPAAYVMDSHLRVSTSRDLQDPQSYFRSVQGNYATSGASGFAGTPMPTLLSRLSAPLGIYEALADRGRQDGSRRLGQLVQVKVLEHSDYLPVP